MGVLRKYSFQSSCNLSPAAASLSPGFPARSLLPPLMALPSQTLQASLFFSPEFPLAYTPPSPRLVWVQVLRTSISSLHLQAE